MAVRIRKDGKIFCAVLSKKEFGDIYLNDAIHEALSINAKILVTTDSYTHNKTNGEWFWKTEIPENVKIDEFYLT